MPSARWSLRAAALIGAGSLVLHQLRYSISYRHQAGEQLAAQGHSYLAFAAPIVVAVLAVAAVAFVLRLLRVSRGRLAEPLPPSARRTWLGASLTVLAVYSLQEIAEGLLSAGHPGGPAALLAHGGAVALPLAVAIGGVIALLLRGAAAAIEVAVRVARLRLPHSRRREAPSRPRPAIRPALDAIALFLAGRGPPQASVQR